MFYPNPVSHLAAQSPLSNPIKGCAALRVALAAALLFAVDHSPLLAQSDYATPYTFTTLAGSAATAGRNIDGTGSAAGFNQPQGVALDGSGNLYVADWGNQTIRKITSGGVVTTLAGAQDVEGSADGTGSNATFYAPSGVAVDGSGNVYVADMYNDTIREITPGGVVTTLAGRAGVPGNGDGTGSDARFRHPTGVAVDSSGNVYVADMGNDNIRKIAPGGVVTTFAGSTSGIYGHTDATGTAALFSGPQGVAVDTGGNIYVAEGDGNWDIRKITPGGAVTTLTGYHYPPSLGSGDGTGSEAQFENLTGLAVDGSGNVYVADEGNNEIRKVTPDGTVTTLGGRAGTGYYGNTDGTGMAARFDEPFGVAVDTSGNIYVADTDNNEIREGTPPAPPLDAFSGSALGSGWYYSSWFGTYNSTFYPWIYRTDIGFCYVDTSDNINLYLYVLNGNPAPLGWLYTNSSIFPNTYSFSKGSWLYFFVGGTSFYNWSTGTFETY